MSADFDSLTNRGEYFAAHYFAEQLSEDLRKGVFAAWTEIETDQHDNRTTPRQYIGRLRTDYLSKNSRPFFAECSEADDPVSVDLNTYQSEDWRAALSTWHRTVLAALGFEPRKQEDSPQEVAEPPVSVHHAGRDHEVEATWHGDGIVVIECGWAASVDTALDEDGPGRLLHPLWVSASERYETGSDLISWLFRGKLGGPDGEPPRFVLLLCGGVLVLADRHSWAERRFLAASLDSALERYDRRQTGELATILALFGRDMIRAGDESVTPRMDELLKASTNNAVAVSSELRGGLQRSVEIIANEVLAQLDAAGMEPSELERPGLPFARELTRETLRYLYRILFLLYAEARPELGILPSDDASYEAGYSVYRLRELVARDEQLVEEAAKNGFHLFESLAVLFDKVNNGHRMLGSGADEDDRGQGLRFEALRSKLFEPDAVRLIGVLDRPSGPLDLRLRNAALHEVLRLLTMKQGQRGGRGGFISYRNLGINQLGAVYEGLMSYTGTIATEELCEVAKDGDPDQGSWLIPAHRQQQYPENTLVLYDGHDNLKGLRGPKRYRPGSFVYRLAGRDRETSASYYTPESLTKVTVELALKYWIKERGDVRAADLLRLKICEPALGSGAFLNEVINQVAEEYLRRRENETGRSLSASAALTEKQKVKAYIALHNAYGVDLNATGVELAEVSLWLNTMHPGMLAPWFGLHLRRGDSLIGARRSVFPGADVTTAAWARITGPLRPTPLPFLRDGERQELPDGAVHQFLLPAPGWAAVCGMKEAKELVRGTPAEADLKRLDGWRKGVLKRAKRDTSNLDNKTGKPKLDKNGNPRPEKPSQYTRLRDAARRVEYLWSLVARRMELSERAISRRIDVWEARGPEYEFLARPESAATKEDVYRDLFDAVDTPYWRLKKVMDAWCALWFWPADKVDLLDGTSTEYDEDRVADSAESLAALLGGAPLVEAMPLGHQAQPTSAATPQPKVVDQIALLSVPGEQTDLLTTEPEDSAAAEFPVEPKVIKPRSTPKAKPKTIPTRRKPTPLRNLDDWLEFLEAMVGTHDAPDGALGTHFDTLDELKQFEESLPGVMGMDVGDPERRFPWLHAVRDIAEDKGFLHWELEFAVVFAKNGGFDLQVGNPPWYRPRWDENAVLAEHEPWFKLQAKPDPDEKAHRREELLHNPHVFADVQREQKDLAARVAWLSSPQVYPLVVGTQPNLYRAFMSQVWDHSSHAGTAGMLHEDTHFTGVKEGALREEAYRRLRVHGDFFNPEHRFFPEPVGETKHFGVHVYGPPGPIGFDHLSWLMSADMLRNSWRHSSVDDIPGIRKPTGEYDDRPRKDRILRVDRNRLATWQRFLGEKGLVERTSLLYPVSAAEGAVIEALTNYPLRLGAYDPKISRGYDESGAKDKSLITYNRQDTATGVEYQPDRWRHVVLTSPQLGVASPVFRRYDADSNDPYGYNLVTIPDDFVPDTEYVRVAGRTPQYLRDQDRWVDHRALARLRADGQAVARARQKIATSEGIPELEVEPEKVDAVLVERSRRRYTVFPRLSWREWFALNTERSLQPALIPRGTAHVDSVHSALVGDTRLTALTAGFWAALPLDYYLRITATKHLKTGQAKRMPAPDPGHPLASALLLRTLRLNCLTKAYAELWAELYDPSWRDNEQWACNWPGLPPLADVTLDWQRGTPLRTERARRSALVEIDALVAVWLRMDAKALIAAYKGGFPVLQRYEAVTYFDADGWKIAGEARTRGQLQGPVKDSWPQLQKHLEAQKKGDDSVLPPDGYTPPFYEAKREEEMEHAHGIFQARLDAAIERGEWDPDAQPSVVDATSSTEDGQEAIDQ